MDKLISNLESERKLLDGRIARGESALVQKDKLGISSVQAELLEEQLKYMVGYIKTLSLRIEDLKDNL